MGISASLASPQAAARGARETCGYASLKAFSEVAFECLKCAEPWRIGVSHGTISNVIRCIIDAELVSDEDSKLLWITKGGVRGTRMRVRYYGLTH
jgi:hypothetical protein